MLSATVLIKTVDADKRTAIITWKLGETLTPNITHYCYYLYADAEELDYIKRRFQNVPITTDNSVVWQGALANFIFHNLYTPS
jgi:hypothetical protein